jgi:poly(3-hydroxybutyrate) depolymerase
MVARRAVLLCLLVLAVPAWARKPRPQETGFLNRTIVLNGTAHKYVVYLPETWSPEASWPVILFLHGSGERGSEGMDQTQIGLPAAIRLHPERWPFIVVMPQVPFNQRHWTDPDMMQTAMAALAAETREFHGDPERTYLTGLSLGGYGVWEIARDFPHVFAAIVPVSGGIFWSYAPQRWQDAGLPAEYARAIGRTPAWLFHGADDPVVLPKQSVVMYEALKAAGGNVRLWEFAGTKHNAWDKAYGNPELPRWLLAHRLGQPNPAEAERVLVPVHPVPARINPAVYDAYVGDYVDQGVTQVTIYRQGDQLFQRNRIGEVSELLPESTTTFFFPSGSTTRLIFEHDTSGAVKGIHLRDDRHEEYWERKRL